MTTKSIQLGRPAPQKSPLSPEGTRTAAVMQAIRQRIKARELVPGDKLPSIRGFAAATQVSTSTVVEAYERLAAQGLIRSRPGAGYFVAGPVAGQPTPFVMAAQEPRLDRSVDPLWISRQSLETDESTLKPGCGWLPAAWLTEGGIRPALRTLARKGQASLAEYGSPLGLLPLRQLLSRRMAAHGIEAAPHQSVLTESGTHAIDLVCRLLLSAGDVVLVDDPCYFNFHALLRAHRAKVVGVAYTPNGPDLDAFAKAVVEHKPRLYITNSAIHNPTGATLSSVSAHRVLKLAEQAGMVIVEDDIFCDFEHAPTPRLAAYDGLDRVVYIGSFSKTLSASARTGYIAARPDWVAGLIDLKIATTFGGGRLNAELVYSVLSDGSYRKHMEGLRLRLARAMPEVSKRLKGMGIVPWLEPQAGMFLWCRLPEGVDASVLAQDALALQLVLAPGNAFSLASAARGFMRFNVAQSQDPRVGEILRKLLKRNIPRQ
jgi:DNA-binding transcriptional MocR family regulator